MAEAEPDLAAFGGIRPGQLVLDAAGGRGRAAAVLAAAGASVVVADRSADALAGMEPALRARVRVVRGDVRALPFPAAAFDAVVLRAAIHHLAEPAEAVREAARVAKPGGVVLIVDKTGPEDLGARALRNAIERLRHRGHSWTFSERELRSLAGAAHLEVGATDSWVERRDAEEWIARGDASPPWDGFLRELLEADLRAGGRATGARVEDGGGLTVEERWAALRLRKPPGGAR